MKIHVSELEGAALSYAVAMAQGYKPTFALWCGEMVACEIETIGDFGDQVTLFYEYHKNWSQCGPLIEAYNVGFTVMVSEVLATCYIPKYSAGHEIGSTHLIAACRAIVAAKLGDEVEIPDELVG